MGIARKGSIGKRAAAWLLAAGLVLGLLGGCRKGEVREETGSLSAEGSTQAETLAQDKGELKAMGRYRETEVELPEEIKDQSYIRFMRGEGGNLELYTADREMPSGKLLEATPTYAGREAGKGMKAGPGMCWQRIWAWILVMWITAETGSIT